MHIIVHISVTLASINWVNQFLLISLVKISQPCKNLYHFSHFSLFFIVQDKCTSNLWLLGLCAVFYQTTILLELFHPIFLFFHVFRNCKLFSCFILSSTWNHVIILYILFKSFFVLGHLQTIYWVEVFLPTFGRTRFQMLLKYCYCKMWNYKLYNISPLPI